MTFPGRRTKGGIWYPADVHYLNLSRGLMLADFVSERFRVLPSELRVCRIQSTACEQKRWAYVLDSLSDDVLYNLAVGNRVHIHDVSEKPRITRALWQGIPWIRHAILTRWWRFIRPALLHRNGNTIDVTRYFDRCVAALPRATKRRLDYFVRFVEAVPDLRAVPWIERPDSRSGEDRFTMIHHREKDT